MKKGFTLIEVLVVAVIVAILAAVAIPAYNGYIINTREQTAKNLCATVASECAVVYAQEGAVTPSDLSSWKTVAANGDYTISVSGTIITVAHINGGTATVNYKP